MTFEPASARGELILTRVLDAPRALVFKAWTDPRHLARWWGPHGFTNPVCEVDLRPGGTLLIHMHGFGGTYPMKGMFVEIVESEKLVFTASVLNDAGEAYLELLNTVTFAEHDGKTTLTVAARVVKTGPGAAEALEGMEAGWNQSFERLAEEVAAIVKYGEQR
jgi:uncharacterized protein YndB with AHSA1/START domain